MLLGIIRIRHQKAMVERLQLRLKLFLRCMQKLEILEVFRKSPASIALDLSNESDRLARLAEVPCFQRGALLVSLQRWRLRGLCLGFGSTQKRHKQTLEPRTTATRMCSTHICRGRHCVYMALLLFLEGIAFSCVC